MIDKIIFVPSALLGLTLAFAYSFLCWRTGRSFNLASMVTLMLHAAGIVAGILLVLSTFSPELRTRLTGIEWYILIGGAAVFAVSLQGVLRDLGTDRTHKQ